MTEPTLQNEPSEINETEDSPARKKLELLEVTGRYVFHGTPDKLTQLEPRQAITGDPVTHENFLDGTPAVAASPDIDTAIFRALLNKKNFKEKKSYSTQWIHDSEGNPVFTANKNALDAVEDVTGYVMVFDKKDFLPYEKNSNEWRSDHAVTPIAIVEIAKHDLPESIAVTD